MTMWTPEFYAITPTATKVLPASGIWAVGPAELLPRNPEELPPGENSELYHASSRRKISPLFKIASRHTSVSPVTSSVSDRRSLTRSASSDDLQTLELDLGAAVLYIDVRKGKLLMRVLLSFWIVKNIFKNVQKVL